MLCVQVVIIVVEINLYKNFAWALSAFKTQEELNKSFNTQPMPLRLYLWKYPTFNQILSENYVSYISIDLIRDINLCLEMHKVSPYVCLGLNHAFIFV